MGSEVKGGPIFSVFLFDVRFRYINRHLKMSFLLSDLNHTSKQRVHIREVTLQVREFCLKRAINYINPNVSVLERNLRYNCSGMWP